MTHTFAIWHSGRPLSNSEAAKVCKKICDGEPAGLLPHAEIEALYVALTAQHPDNKNIDPDRFVRLVEDQIFEIEHRNWHHYVLTLRRQNQASMLHCILCAHLPSTRKIWMAEAKTKPTQVNVEDYLKAKASPEQLIDCNALISLLERITGEAPKMWGPSIVGFGSYSYRYESGRTGESCATGFAIRGREIVLYLVAEDAKQAALLAKLGKHKMGKACLYFKRLADLDSKVLADLVEGSVAEVRRRHPGPGVA